MALAQERERELAQRDSLIRVLTETRDQALATLQRHGLAIPTQLPSKEKQTAINAHGTADQRDLPAEEKIKALEVQNADLRAVIRQMRHHHDNQALQHTFGKWYRRPLPTISASYQNRRRPASQLVVKILHVMSHLSDHSP